MERSIAISDAGRSVVSAIDVLNFHVKLTSWLGFDSNSHTILAVSWRAMLYTWIWPGRHSGASTKFRKNKFFFFNFQWICWIYIFEEVNLRTEFVYVDSFSWVKCGCLVEVKWTLNAVFILGMMLGLSFILYVWRLIYI